MFSIANWSSKGILTGKKQYEYRFVHFDPCCHFDIRNINATSVPRLYLVIILSFICSENFL